VPERPGRMHNSKVRPREAALVHTKSFLHKFKVGLRAYLSNTEQLICRVINNCPGGVPPLY
jgi:hypothetical protein